MSLRVRLLLAVGAVAFIALLVADVATYSSLRSFLFNQVDQSLLSSRQPPAGRPRRGRRDAGHVPAEPAGDVVERCSPRNPILGGFRRASEHPRVRSS